MPNKKNLSCSFSGEPLDGLNIVVPFGEENYYRIRPTIAIPQPRQGWRRGRRPRRFFSAASSLAPLGPLFHNGQLAIVHATGSPDTTRSHFDAQDFMESGYTRSEIYRRRLAQPHGASAHEENSYRSRRGHGSNLPLTLRVLAPAIALADVKQFRVLSESKAVQADSKPSTADRRSSSPRDRHGNV